MADENAGKSLVGSVRWFVDSSPDPLGVVLDSSTGALVPDRNVYKPQRGTDMGAEKGTVVGGYRCSGPHRYFVAETVGVPSRGEVHLIALCTDCGDTIFKTFSVGTPTELTLKNKKEKD